MTAAQQWMPCTKLEVNTDAPAASFLFVCTQQTIGRHNIINVKLLASAGTAAILHSFTLAQPTKRMSLARKNEEAAAKLKESEEAAASLQESKKSKDSKRIEGIKRMQWVVSQMQCVSRML